MAMFQQDIKKKKGKKLSKEEKKIVKRVKKQEKERKRQQKINEKNVKKRNKKKQSNRARDDYYSTVDGFKFTLSFIETNGRYASILKLDNKYGTNRNMQYGWFINLIPEVNIKGVTAKLIVKDKLMDENNERKIIRDRSSSVISTSEETGAIIGNKENEGDETIKAYRSEDFKRAQVNAAQQDTQSIVDFEVYVMLTSDNADKIVDQVENINTIYNEENKGIQISSVAGQQQAMLEELFEPVKGDINNFTLMSGDYAGNDHIVRKGLNDVEDAVPVGLLTESYTRGISTMSINERFKNDTLVAAPETDVIDSKYDSNLSSSSLWGQLIANDVMVHGHKVFHIVLNDFYYAPEKELIVDEKNQILQEGGWVNYAEDEEGMPEYLWDSNYKKEPHFMCTPTLNEELSYQNLIYGGVNSLETFAKDTEDNRKRISQLFTNTVEKNIRMMYLMSKRKMGDKERRDLRRLLIDFYQAQDLWDTNAINNPYAARILGLDSDTIPTLNDFVLKLSTNVIGQKGKNSVSSEAAEDLHDTLDAALESNNEVFGTQTKLPPPDEIQTHQNYYDLSEFDDYDLMEAEFINIFGYISEAAKKDDVIMIHGVNRLSLETLEILRDDLRKLKRKNVRMAYLFDCVGSGSVKKEGKNYIERADVFNTNGYLYTNLERDFGITIFGTMTEDELSQYQRGVKQILTENMKEALTDTKNRDQYQIRSGEGSQKSTVMVNSYFVI